MKKLIVTILSLSLMVFSACSDGGQAETADQTVIVKAAEAELGTLSTEGTYIGIIENTEEVELVSYVSGTLTDVNVSVGDTVSKGSVLAKFDDTSAKIELESAKNGVESAEKSLESAYVNVESAEAGYESKMISGTNELNSEHELSDYKSEMNIHSIESNIAYQEDKINTFKETTLKDAQDDVKKYKKKKKKAKIDYDEEAYAEYSSLLDSAEDALENAEKELKDLEYNYSSAVREYESAVGQREITNGEVYAGKQQEVLNSLEVAQKNVDSAKVGVESAKVSVEAATNKVDAAEYQLSLYTLTAPIGGVIEKVNVEENNYFSAGNVSFVISNPDSRRAVFHVPDTVAAELKAGQEILASSNGKEYAGEVSEIGVAVDDTGLFQVKAEIFDAGDLSDGVGVKLSTVIHRSGNKVLIPTDAVYFKENQAFVYVVQEGIAVRKDVEVDIYGENMTSLLSGIDAGETVITTWSGSLHDGSEISVEKEPESMGYTELSGLSAGVGSF